MKKLLKIILSIFAVIAVVIALVVAAVFYFTSGLVDTADAFFNSVKQKDIAKARSFLSEDFKASTDENALEAFLSEGALLNFKEANWSQRSIEGLGRGALTGSIITESGGVTPITLMFVKENDAWKIYAIHNSPAGLQSQDSAPSLPTSADQAALTKQSMRDFAAGINSKNMESFRETISQFWKKQVTTEELNKAFATFMDQNIDLTVLEPLEPVFDGEPRIDEDGLLVITGNYPTEPSQVAFDHRYLYEGSAWKLVGFNIDIE